MNIKTKRILLSAAGVLIGAVSVGAFKLAAFGVDPFQSFMSGVDALIPIPFGTLYVIVNAVLLIFFLVFDRRYIGIATFINLFLLGYVVDFSHMTLLSWFPDASMVTRSISFVLGFVFLCFGSSLYMTADMGVSTYDAVALILSEKWKVGKFKYVRICTDLTCIVLGVACYLVSGGEAAGILAFVGVGTMLTAFCMGPLIDLFNRAVALPILHGRKN